MRKLDLLLAGLLFAAPAFAQFYGPTRTAQDAKVVYEWDFETDWDSWTLTPVDQIFQIEYYNHSGNSSGIFRPWTDQENWQRGLFRDTVINLYPRVEITDNLEEIQGNYYPNDNYGIITDYSIERSNALSQYGEDCGERYFNYVSDIYEGYNSSYGSHTSEGYAAEYRRYLSIPGIPIEPESSYRVTFYVKANKTSDDAPTPKMYANIMRGIKNVDKPFSMGCESDNANYKYNMYFDYQKDVFTGDWEKVSFMTYYLNDSIAENFVYSNGYWWAENNWTWNADDNPTYDDLNYIVQPNQFFARLSFSSDLTDFQVDNLSITKSWIAGVEYYNDKLRVDFGYKTNISDLANAAYAEYRIPAREVDAYVPDDMIDQLGYEYYFEVWGLNKKGVWEDVPIRSAEYHDDGYMYMFTDYYMIGDEWYPFLFEDYDSVLVTFHNPVNNPDLCLKYTGTGSNNSSEVFPNALDTTWIKAGKIVPDFYNEVATPNPYIFNNVYSMKDQAPVMQEALYEDGSFGLSGSISEFRFKFSREVVINNETDPTKKAVAYVGSEMWDLVWDANNSELVLTRPSSYSGDLEGDYEIQIIQIYGIGTGRGEDVVVHYNFGPVTRILGSQLVAKSDWRSEIFEETWDRPMPASLYTYNNSDGFYGGDGHNYSPYKKNGLFKANDDGEHGDCFFYFTARTRNYFGNLWTTENLTAGNYIISFPAFGWARNTLVTEVYVYPQPAEMTYEALEGSTKTKIGEIIPSKQTNWSDNNESRDWIDGVETFEFTFNIPFDGDYVIEWKVNLDGSQSYYGVCVGNYSISTAGDMSYASIAALNKSVDAAKARLALAFEDIAHYGGTAYDALGTKIAYYDYNPEGLFTSTIPSEWTAAKKDLDDATAAMKTRMTDVDLFINELNRIGAILADFEALYSGLASWQSLNNAYNDGRAINCPEKTTDELYNLINQYESAKDALFAHIDIIEKYYSIYYKIDALIADYEKPDCSEFADLVNVFSEYSSFDPITAIQDNVVDATAVLNAKARTYQVKVLGSELLPMRINALAELANRLGSDISNNAAVMARLDTLETDDDALADVFKAAIKLSIYEKVKDGILDSLDLTPFIKNYNLYTTPLVVERTDIAANNIMAREPDPDGAQIQHVQHQWNNNDLDGIWVMITDNDYSTLYPGWTVRATATGNYMVTSDDNSYSRLREGLPLFDGEIGMDWNGRAELHTILHDLPTGEYTLGVELMEHTVNSSYRTTLSAITSYYYYSSIADVSGPQLLSVDCIEVADGDSLYVDFVLSSGSGWSCADNFFLTFSPLDNYDYYAAIADAEAELQEAINRLNNSTDPGTTPGLSDWTSRNHDYYSSSSKTWNINADEASILSFDWTVRGYYYDRLSITLDGELVMEVSVDGYNQLKSGIYEGYIDLGSHTLIATYTKEGYSYSNSDQASVKNIRFNSIENLLAQKIAHVREVAANNNHINTTLLAEANDYISQLESGQYDASNVFAVIVPQLDEYATRLSYTHLDINVVVPGAMGDSILAKVENFADVQSLRLTGKLNSDDIETLKNRLTSIIEVDLNGLDWVNIPNNQFYGKSNLQYVILPANVQSIGNQAFYNCTGLKQIVFPATLKSIGDYAFYRTYNIGNVLLPEGLTYLGNYAFYQSGITSVTFPSTLKTINYECFNNCDNLVVINFNGQTTIGEYAFHYCDNISLLSFPATLTSIGYGAFYGCRGLYEIEFNEGLISLGDYAFYDCDGLTTVTLPSSLQTLNGAYSFCNCDNLRQVTCKTIVPPYCDDNVTGRNGLDLYVPLLSVNVYKQTSGWDQFIIHGINIMPDNIVIQSDYKLNWPDTLNVDYKPNVTVTGSYDSNYGNYNYGSLTVNGNSTLSAGQYILKYDSYNAYNRRYWDSEWGTYYYDRSTYASLVNNANVRADNITIEYWMRANKWEFFTVPFDVKVSDIRMDFEGTPFVIRKYDGEKRAAGLTGETWVDMTADSILHAGEGYIWRSASTDPDNRYYNVFYLDALQTVNKNNVFANDNVEVSLSYYESEFAHNRSWNLIGNPYPCFYDIRAMQTSAPITVWDTYQGNYRAYSPEDDNYILNPGQAFFVQRPVNEESIIFLKEGRQTDLTVRDVEYNAVNHAPNRASSAVKTQRSVFNIILSNGEQFDRTRFVINESALKAYEQSHDASKFSSLVPVSQLYTIEDGVHFAINERPLSDGIITLGMTIANQGIYTLTLNTKVNQEVWLMDLETGKEILLNGDGGYTFSAEAGTYENRFVLRMGNGVITGVNNVDIEQDATEHRYDLLGRPIDATQKGIYIKDGKKVIVK